MGHCIIGAETSWFQTVIKQIGGNLYCGEKKLMQSLPAVWPFQYAFRQNFEGWLRSSFSSIALLLWLEDDSQVQRQSLTQQKFKHLHSFEHVSNPVRVNKTTLNA